MGLHAAGADSKGTMNRLGIGNVAEMPGSSPIGDMADQPTSSESDTKSALPDPHPAEVTHGKEVRDVARALAAFAPRLGWGLLSLGLLSGLARALAPAAVESPTWSVWAVAVANGVSLGLALGLSGWILGLLCKVVAALLIEHVDRSASGSWELIAELRRVTALLERWIEVGGWPREPAVSQGPSSIDRTRRLAEIDRARRLRVLGRSGVAPRRIPGGGSRRPDHRGDAGTTRCRPSPDDPGKAGSARRGATR